jgi:hypothetical protein
MVVAPRDTVNGRPRSTRRCPEFDTTIQLPAGWIHSNELVNIDSELLDACARRISQQRTFDRKPLGLAVQLLHDLRTQFYTI